jgi:peptidylprolyl isomerase
VNTPSKEANVRSSSALRRLPALIGAAALATATLAGCAAGAGGDGCAPEYAAGDASSIVTATGAVGSSPAADFPTPLISPTTQVSVLEHGAGDVIRPGQQVDYSIAVFYGEDGQKLSGDSINNARTEAGLAESSLNRAMDCAHVGDRLAVTTTLADAYGAGAGATANIADDATLVVILDLNAAYLGKANGFNLLPQDGMPVVVTEVDGTPGIAVDFVTKPAKTRVETVKAGDGTAVKKGDAVVVHLRAWTWPDSGNDPAEILVTTSSGATRPINTWALHQAATATAGDTAASLPPGVATALEGATVGSQLLVVVPPGDGHYTTVPSSLAGLTTDQTMIWVVDILGIQK